MARHGSSRSRTPWAKAAALGSLLATPALAYPAATTVTVTVASTTYLDFGACATQCGDAGFNKLYNPHGSSGGGSVGTQGGGSSSSPGGNPGANPGANQGGTPGANPGGSSGINPGGKQAGSYGGNAGGNKGADQGGNPGGSSGGGPGGSNTHVQGGNTGGNTSGNYGSTSGGNANVNQGGNSGGSPGGNVPCYGPPGYDHGKPAGPGQGAHQGAGAPYGNGPRPTAPPQAPYQAHEQQWVTLDVPTCDKVGATSTIHPACDVCHGTVFNYQPTDVEYVTITTHGGGPTATISLKHAEPNCQACKGTVYICEPTGHPFPGYGEGDAVTMSYLGSGPDANRITVPPSYPGGPSTVIIGGPDHLNTITLPGAGPGSPTHTVFPTGANGEPLAGATPFIIIGDGTGDVVATVSLPGAVAGGPQVTLPPVTPDGQPLIVQGADEEPELFESPAGSGSGGNSGTNGSNRPGMGGNTGSGPAGSGSGATGNGNIGPSPNGTSRPGASGAGTSGAGNGGNGSNGVSGPGAGNTGPAGAGAGVPIPGNTGTGGSTIGNNANGNTGAVAAFPNPGGPGSGTTAAGAATNGNGDENTATGGSGSGTAATDGSGNGNSGAGDSGSGTIGPTGAGPDGNGDTGIVASAVVNSVARPTGAVERPALDLDGVSVAQDVASVDGDNNGDGCADPTENRGLQLAVYYIIPDDSIPEPAIVGATDPLQITQAESLLGAIPTVRRTMNYRGYVFGCVPGVYTLRTPGVNSAIYVWLGDKAISGFNSGNADITSDATSEATVKRESAAASCRFESIAEQYVPIRIICYLENGSDCLLALVNPDGIVLFDNTPGGDPHNNDDAPFYAKAPNGFPQFPEFGAENPGSVVPSINPFQPPKDNKTEAAVGVPGLAKPDGDEKAANGADGNGNGANTDLANSDGSGKSTSGTDGNTNATSPDGKPVVALNAVVGPKKSKIQTSTNLGVPKPDVDAEVPVTDKGGKTAVDAVEGVNDGNNDAGNGANGSGDGANNGGDDNGNGADTNGNGANDGAGDGGAPISAQFSATDAVTGDSNNDNGAGNGADNGGKPLLDVPISVTDANGDKALDVGLTVGGPDNAASGANGDGNGANNGQDSGAGDGNGGKPLLDIQAPIKDGNGNNLLDLGAIVGAPNGGENGNGDDNGADGAKDGSDSGAGAGGRPLLDLSIPVEDAIGHKLLDLSTIVGGSKDGGNGADSGAGDDAANGSADGMNGNGAQDAGSGNGGKPLLDIQVPVNDKDGSKLLDLGAVVGDPNDGGNGGDGNGDGVNGDGSGNGAKPLLDIKVPVKTTDGANLLGIGLTAGGEDGAGDGDDTDGAGDSGNGDGNGANGADDNGNGDGNGDGNGTDDNNNGNGDGSSNNGKPLLDVQVPVKDAKGNSLLDIGALVNSPDGAGNNGDGSNNGDGNGAGDAAGQDGSGDGSSGNGDKPLLDVKVPVNDPNGGKILDLSAIVGGNNGGNNGGANGGANGGDTGSGNGDNGNGNNGADGSGDGSKSDNKPLLDIQVPVKTADGGDLLGIGATIGGSSNDDNTDGSGDGSDGNGSNGNGSGGDGSGSDDIPTADTGTGSRANLADLADKVGGAQKLVEIAAKIPGDSATNHPLLDLVASVGGAEQLLDMASNPGIDTTGDGQTNLHSLADAAGGADNLLDLVANLGVDKSEILKLKTVVGSSDKLLDLAAQVGNEKGITAHAQVGSKGLGIDLNIPGVGNIGIGPASNGLDLHPLFDLLGKILGLGGGGSSNAGSGDANASAGGASGSAASDQDPACQGLLGGIACLLGGTLGAVGKTVAGVVGGVAPGVGKRAVLA